MDKIINYKLAEVFSFLYALVIVLSAFQYTAIILVWLLAIFIFPYLIINLKYTLDQKHKVRISNFLIIVIIGFQIAENLITVIQLFDSNLITYAINTLKSLFITFKGIAFLIISIQLTREKLHKKLRLLKADLFLLGGFYIVSGIISQLSILSYIAKLGVTPNALLIVFIISQMLYIVLLLLLGVLFRSSSISIVN